MEITAPDLLRSYDNPSLQQMLRQRGSTEKGLNKEQMVAALARTLYSPRAIQAVPRP